MDSDIYQRSNCNARAFLGGFDFVLSERVSSGGVDSPSRSDFRHEFRTGGKDKADKRLFFQRKKFRIESAKYRGSEKAGWREGKLSQPVYQQYGNASSRPCC
jgi:hypothetical protein